MSKRRSTPGLMGLLLLGGCAVAPQIPEGEGQGLVNHSREAAKGVETFGRPTFLEGDRFIYERAGAIEISMRVVQATAKGYRLRNELSQVVTTYDLDLGLMSEGVGAEGETPLRVLAPVDARYCWPLWEGKEWTCDYVDKRPGGPVVPLLVRYHCDAIETIRVPAGEFRCLRIWRRSKPVRQGNFTEWCTVYWYAPKVGFVVRELDGGHELQLVQYQKQ